MSSANEVEHPGIRDKWEARICSEPLNQQMNILTDIQRQLADTKEEITKLEEKRQMHERDIAYVAQLIASKLPPPVVAEARRESTDRSKTV